MTAYELPTSLNISGVDFSIRTDFRVIIDILVAMNDPELDEQAKAVVMLQILFEDWQSMPPEYLAEACTCLFSPPHTHVAQHPHWFSAQAQSRP